MPAILIGVVASSRPNGPTIPSGRTFVYDPAANDYDAYEVTSWSPLTLALDGTFNISSDAQTGTYVGACVSGTAIYRIYCTDQPRVRLITYALDNYTSSSNNIVDTGNNLFPYGFIRTGGTFYVVMDEGEGAKGWYSSDGNSLTRIGNASVLYTQMYEGSGTIYGVGGISGSITDNKLYVGIDVADGTYDSSLTLKLSGTPLNNVVGLMVVSGVVYVIGSPEGSNWYLYQVNLSTGECASLGTASQIGWLANFAS